MFGWHHFDLTPIIRETIDISNTDCEENPEKMCENRLQIVYTPKLDIDLD
jgi:hypothetical protein